jgi:zinc transporter 1/2/3
MSTPWWEQFDPTQVTIANDTVSDAWKVCVLEGVYFGGNAYNGELGARISSIFVILFTSTVATLFPVLATKVKSLRIPTYVYLFARNFGTGVIVATAFVHLMDPAYQEIGPNTCVGMTDNWAVYSWPPAIILITVFFIFFMDLFSAVYVDRKYNYKVNDINVEGIITKQVEEDGSNDIGKIEQGKDDASVTYSEIEAAMGYDSQLAAFLILEFGVVFHSVMIGLNLGSCGPEFNTLYVVIVFHQCFEGLGIGSRLSAIPFPKEKAWLQYALCLAYGLTTPISIAIGVGLRTTYDSGSFSANVVSGILDSISAGILIYTAMVELLARDFIFNDERSKDLKRLVFSVTCCVFGAGIMALLGKWA